MKDIKTDNELIAEFMGATPCIVRVKSIGDERGYECDDFKLPTDELRYHTSWNWLMPVVEKILEIVDEETREINSEGLAIFELAIGTPISEVYKAAVEFIKFYNSQNQ